MSDRFLTLVLPLRLDKDNPHRLTSSSLDNTGKMIETLLNKDDRLVNYDFKQALWMELGLLVIFQKRE